MKKIDIHTHIIPEKWPNFSQKFGYSGFLEIRHCESSNCTADLYRDDGNFFRKIESNCWDPKVRILDCEATAVTKQVLSTIPVFFNYWAKPQDTLAISQFLNDHIAGLIVKNPHNFYGLGTLPMQDPELACLELKRCVQDLKLQGVQIGSHVGDKNLDDPSYYPLYEEMEKLSASLFVHPWDMMGASTMKKYWLPWLVGMPAETSRAICSMIFGNIFEKFPKLRVAFAHGGGSFPATIGRISHGHAVRPDLCAIDHKIDPRNSIGKFFIDSLVHDRNTLSSLVNLFGADKICLGSDYPFPLGEAHPGKLIQDLYKNDQKIQDQLLFKSAMNWLGVDK